MSPRFGSLFMFIAVFAPSVAGAWVDYPKGCASQKTFPCAVMFEGGDELAFSGSQMRGEIKTAILLESRQQLKILSGNLWVQTDGLWLQHLSRRLKVKGQALLQADGHRLRLMQMEGDTEVTGGNLVPGEKLFAGFENWWDISTQGLKRPFRDSEVLSIWNKTFRPSRLQAQEFVARWKPLWEGRVEEASQLYQQIVDIRWTEQQKKEEEKYQRHLAQQQQRQRLRDMFRERYFQP